MHTLPNIVKEVDNIGRKAQLSEQEIMDFTNKHLDKKYPIKEWMRIYTDGSATDAVRIGSCGVHASLPDGNSLARPFACEMRCTNYKAKNRSHQRSRKRVQ
ncbi:hypothetical protein ElyMa_004054000 [Elysia marginata]|uniref:RNase H type-1 domain-containing protein n=1 Tax=Elysia marginata TaxID=1093978 RepID=A0AAV4G6J7_9GAST|nr:hypothetical protein ElyMa_004054000 [Elysia marginata]